MSKFQNLRWISTGPVSKVRFMDYQPFDGPWLTELTNEWDSLADRADCQTLLVDCSNVELLSSYTLSKLILLQRRLKQKNARLVLTGLGAGVREVLSWTKLDRFFEIDEEAASAALA